MSKIKDLQNQILKLRKKLEIPSLEISDNIAALETELVQLRKEWREELASRAHKADQRRVEKLGDQTTAIEGEACYNKGCPGLVSGRSLYCDKCKNDPNRTRRPRMEDVSLSICQCTKCDALFTDTDKTKTKCPACKAGNTGEETMTRRKSIRRSPEEWGELLQRVKKEQLQTGARFDIVCKALGLNPATMYRKKREIEAEAKAEVDGGSSIVATERSILTWIESCMDAATLESIASAAMDQHSKAVESAKRRAEVSQKIRDIEEEKQKLIEQLQELEETKKNLLQE